jgi:uncharacterized protein (TIGR02271 family)
MTRNQRDPYDFDIDAVFDERSPAPADTDQDTINIALAEETMEARIVERQQGKVRIHTSVETQRVKASVDLHADEYVVERHEVNEDADARREPWYEGDSLMIPVYEEVLVTKTQLVLREVIRLRNTGSIERVDLKGVVRRDVVDITQIDA